jgi:hypothetical protein
LAEQAAPELAGEHAVYYGTKLSGASNHEAKQAINFKASPFNRTALTPYDLKNAMNVRCVALILLKRAAAGVPLLEDFRAKCVAEEWH